MEDKVPSAYYKLTDNRRQIMSYVFDVIRGSVPRMELDEAFASKDHIANAVKDQLSISMAEYGYEIVATLVVDLDPNNNVKAAMNEINGKIQMTCMFMWQILIFLCFLSFLFSFCISLLYSYLLSYGCYDAFVT